MQWQIFKGATKHRDAGIMVPVALPELYDDGIWSGPGDPGFTTDHVIAEMKRLKADSYAYVGYSTLVGERTEAAIAPRVTELLDHVVAKHIEIETEADADEVRKGYAEEVRSAVLSDMGLAEI